MNLPRIAARMRELGLAGTLAAVGRRGLHWTRLRRLALARTTISARRIAARRLPFLKRPHGVNLVAYIRAEMGLGQVARGMAAALDQSHLPYGIINLEEGNASRHGDMSWAHKEVPSSGFDTTIVCVNPDNSRNLRLFVPKTVLGDSYVIGNWYWELTEIPDEWMPDFHYVDEVWAPTRFIQDALTEKSPVPVVHMPPVVQVHAETSFPRSHFGLPEDRYLFLAMADAASVIERKNPFAVLEAFRQAFGGSDDRVGLVLKFNNSFFASEKLRRLAEEARALGNVFFIDKVMTRDEIASLVAATDCYVSLHRSEGFGLGPAEAMLLGKPAIVTNWSGNTDYMTADNCAPVRYELVPLGQSYYHGLYRADLHWAEPDVGHAAEWMKRLAADPALGRELGRRGRETISTQHSPARVGRLIERRLRFIRRNILRA